METVQEQLTQEDVRRMIAEATADTEGKQQEEKAAPKEETFSIRLPGGVVLEGTSQADLQRKIDEIERQLTLQREVERVKADADQGRQEQTKQVKAEGGEDSKKYLESLAKKFEDGDGYGFQEQLLDGYFKRKFGYGVDEFVGRTHQAISMSAEVAQVTAAKAFMDRHPEYEANPQNSAAMQEIIKARNYATDVEGLEDAYRFGVARGIIKTRAVEEEEAPKRVKTPPRVGTSKGRDLHDEESDLEAFENMTLQQQEAVLMKMARGRR